MKLQHIYITRFLAALLVVVYHFGSMISPFQSGILKTIVQFGDEAVTYFFILSGFIMVIAYYPGKGREKKFDKKTYWLNRFARIYPVYILALLGVALYYWTVDNSIFNSFVQRLPIEIVLLQSWIGKVSLNFPGWSLSVELLFYLLFPFLLKTALKMSTKRLGIFSVLIYLLTQVICIYLINRYTGNVKAQLAVNYFPLFNLSAFFAGITGGIIFVRNKNIFEEKALPIKFIGYSAAAISLLLIVWFLDIEKYHRNGLLLPVYFFFLLAFCAKSKLNGLLGNRLFVFLGDISYSLYILQYPVWLFFGIIVSSLHLSATLHFYSYLLSLIALSAFIYLTFEKPVQKWIRNKRHLVLDTHTS